MVFPFPSPWNDKIGDDFLLGLILKQKEQKPSMRWLTQTSCWQRPSTLFPQGCPRLRWSKVRPATHPPLGARPSCPAGRLPTAQLRPLCPQHPGVQVGAGPRRKKSARAAALRATDPSRWPAARPCPRALSPREGASWLPGASCGQGGGTGGPRQEKRQAQEERRRACYGRLPGRA